MCERAAESGREWQRTGKKKKSIKMAGAIVPSRSHDCQGKIAQKQEVRKPFIALPALTYFIIQTPINGFYVLVYFNASWRLSIIHCYGIVLHFNVLNSGEMSRHMIEAEQTFSSIIFGKIAEILRLRVIASFCTLFHASCLKTR